jgi:hypothetical protein
MALLAPLRGKPYSLLVPSSRVRVLRAARCAVANERIELEMVGTNVRWRHDGGEAESRRVPIGPCSHKLCGHSIKTVVAEGGTLEHYELMRCDVPSPPGCGGRCRGWMSITHPRGVARWIELN